ncbi:Ff.00g038400.m01.CDS01 [Fusarium sp. VM40]|nr:Ff.00g038400.m01.CDS01 [Fusarium sp. VM40]
MRFLNHHIYHGSALALAFAWLIPHIDRLRLIEQQPYILELDLYERRQRTPEDPCPTAIRARIPGISKFTTFQAVHQALKLCDTIDVLQLSASRASCVGFPEGYRMPFSLNGSDRYLSAPRVLSLEEYEFDYSEWAEIRPPVSHWSNEDGSWPVSPSTIVPLRWILDMFYRGRWHLDRLTYAMKQLAGIGEFSRWQEFGMAQQWYDQRYLPAERQSMDDIQHWLEAMDFSKVHTLTINEGFSVTLRGKGLYEQFPRALTGMQSLTIQGEWKNWEAEREGIYTLPTAKNFILGLKTSLESLEWKEGGTCGEDAFDAVLKHHGATLEHLEWTNSEIDFHPRPVPSLAQLRGLGEWAPRLESLAIDLHRDAGDWPQEELKTIAENLPDLTTLVLYLNARDEAPFQNHSYYTLNRTVLLEPRLDTEAAISMFRTLRQYKVGDTFDTVEFREGDWAESFGGGQVSFRDDWMGGVKIWFKCRMVERDGVSEAECETRPPLWW